MKRTTYIFILVIMILSFSCHKALKDVNDYFPKVTTVSAIIKTNGSVLITGKIESEGNAPIQYAGVCYNTMGNPTLENNQKTATLSGDAFSCTYSGFLIDSTYYFRTWATNDYGYSYGNIIVLDSIN